jgi:hypothetical protein
MLPSSKFPIFVILICSILGVSLNEKFFTDTAL